MNWIALWREMTRLWSYDEVRMMFAVACGMLAFGAMIINNLTWRKVISLIVIFTGGWVLYSWGLTIVDRVVREAEFDLLSEAYATIFFATGIAGFLLAKAALLVFVKPRKKFLALAQRALLGMSVGIYSTGQMLQRISVAMRSKAAEISARSREPIEAREAEVVARAFALVAQEVPAPEKEEKPNEIATAQAG